MFDTLLVLFAFDALDTSGPLVGATTARSKANAACSGIGSAAQQVACGVAGFWAWLEGARASVVSIFDAARSAM
ncbi:hypothetical protein F6X37_22875 [Paraburkholderia sp. 31.1]|uniref:hypothetical protein n=1 Tax=Paraburkholderia sp. 31.1 TaxID=2615205 RepID=UPI001654E0A1|nr:hypothetical protein [Paraburkholderia sp. 31.1]MBC8724329.1 hypothetical protein [Paraburkholderia sp. 31.1]